MTMTLDKAQVTLPSDSEVKVERSFKAPRALVYRAYTEPQLLTQWLLGPPGWTMPICEMDVRVGGAYRWQWRSADGTQEFGFHGVFREVQPQARLVHSEAYDPGTVGGGYPEGKGEDAIVTVTFTEEAGITTVTSLMDFRSKEARDAAVKTGMTDGMEQSYQLLDRLIEQQPRS
jgi:uncharacterized protein YndB with AHSA1/START domain